MVFIDDLRNKTKVERVKELFLKFVCMIDEFCFPPYIVSA